MYSVGIHTSIHAHTANMGKDRVDAAKARKENTPPTSTSTVYSARTGMGGWSGYFRVSRCPTQPTKALTTTTMPNAAIAPFSRMDACLTPPKGSV